MEDNLRVVSRAFFYLTLVLGSCLAIGFSIASGEIVKGLAFGFLGGLLSSVFMSIYLLIGLILFQYKLFFYGKMPKQLRELGARNIFFESVAGDASGARIKYGGLFLTDDSVIFVPHRFAIKPLIIELPLIKINKVDKTGVNFFKYFSGGLRSRLCIESINDNHYEFSVWDIDKWIQKINERINATPGSKQ